MNILNICLLVFCAASLLITGLCYKFVNKKLLSPFIEKSLLSALVLGFIIARLYFSISEYINHTNELNKISSVLGNYNGTWNSGHWVGSFLYSKMKSDAFLINLPSIFLLASLVLIVFSKTGTGIKAIAPVGLAVALFDIIGQYYGSLATNVLAQNQDTAVPPTILLNQQWWDYIFLGDKHQISVTPLFEEVVNGKTLFGLDSFGGIESGGYYIAREWFRFPIDYLLLMVSFVSFFRASQYTRWSWLGFGCANIFLLLIVFIEGKLLNLNFFAGGFASGDWTTPILTDGNNLDSSIYSPFRIYCEALGLNYVNWFSAAIVWFLIQTLFVIQIIVLKNILTVDATKISQAFTPWYAGNILVGPIFARIDANINNRLYRVIPYGLISLSYIVEKRVKNLEDLKYNKTSVEDLTIDEVKLDETIANFKEKLSKKEERKLKAKQKAKEKAIKKQKLQLQQTPIEDVEVSSN